MLFRSLSKALDSLPPYVFAALDRLKADARQRGIEFDDLGIGSPDRPTPPSIVEAMFVTTDATHRLVKIAPLAAPLEFVLAK